MTTTYPGASAKTLVETVALPIEQQVNGVEKMLYMQSTCTSDGRYTLTVTFQVGTDLDFAQVLVQNRVAAAMAQLPSPVQQQGVVTKKKETSPLQIITLSSKGNRYDALFLSNFATLQLSDKLARLPGVGDVVVFGVGEYSMRVWLDPQQMLQRSLMPSDIVNALQAQNAYVAAGQVGMPPTPSGQDFQLTVNVPAALADAKEFEDIIVKTSAGGQVTRIRDVGRVELGARSYSQVFRMDGSPAGGIAIYQLPDANALDTAKGVKNLLATLSPGFPEGLTYAIPFDTTTFVKESVHEVYRTLFEAGILVLIVIMVFLQDWRATLVPATTVPVTIIGAFAAMAAMGFSINLLTLFAVVLAIGIVVDDAIVVVEGVAKHVEHGQTPKQGAIDAMKELMGPIIGITLVLDVGVPAAGVHAGDHRADVPAVRAGDRGDGADQGGERADAEADAVRAVVAREGSEREEELLLPVVQLGVRARGAVVRAVDPVHGGAEPPDGGDRAGVDRAGGLGPDAGADRLHPHRGPGLPHGGRADARRRVARAHSEGDGRRRPDRPRDSRREACDRDRHGRSLAARRRRVARQRRHRVPDARRTGASAARART